MPRFPAWRRTDFHVPGGAPPVRFVTLDAMRGIAAISVMFFHYLFHNPYHLFYQAFYAVDFFFCLSGAILTHSYEKKIIAGMRFREYAERRMIRFYPLYLLGFFFGSAMLVMYAKSGTIVDFTIRDYVLSEILNAFFLPYPNAGISPFFTGGTINGVIFPVDVPAWSLFFELLASAALFFALRWRIRPGYIVIISLPLLGGSLLFFRSANLGWGTDTFIAGFSRTAFAFFGGVVLYRLYLRMRLAGSVRPWGLLIGAAIAFALPLWGLVGLLFFSVFIPALIFLGLMSEDHVKGRIFENLGRLSYGIYVLHWPIYQLLVIVLSRSALSEDGGPTSVAVIASIVTIFLAYVLTKFIDEPARRWLSRRLIVKGAPMAA